MAPHYDIFISYRRSSYESANLIAEKLRSAGYTVFFDMETLRSGKFNVQLYKVIESCKDFIVVLPPNALDRCSDSEDWVRKEVCHAMDFQKNIVPVMLTGFEWPEIMPQGMEELRNYQAVTPTSHEYFDLKMTKLAGYLRSKPKKKYQALIIKILGGLAALFMLAGIAYFSFLKMAIPVCTETANTMTHSMGLIEILAHDNRNLEKDWTEFFHWVRVNQRTPLYASRKAEMYNLLDYYEHEASDLLAKTPIDTFVLSDYQTFLLSLYDIDKIELQIFTPLCQSFLDDLLHNIATIRQQLDTDDYGQISKMMNEISFESYQNMVNMLYYSYVELLSLMPEESRAQHQQISSKWTMFPNGISLNLSKEEYEAFQRNEQEQYDAKIAKAQNYLFQKEDELSIIESKLDTLQAVANLVDANIKAKAVQDAKLNTRREIVETKRQYVESQQQELDNMNEKYAEMYDKLKEKCTIKADDDPGYMWGKVARWSANMARIVDYNKKLRSQGLDQTSRVTPALAYQDLEQMLSDYQKYNPGSASFIPSVKAFYKEVSLGNLPLAGILIFDFENNAEHPVYKIGDIVVSRNGEPVSNFEELQIQAKKSDGQGSATVMRLEHGKLTECSLKIPKTDIRVGYMELKEKEQ